MDQLKTPVKLSIVIPTLNEVRFLPLLVKHLYDVARNPDNFEVIISDGGSTDDTLESIKAYPAKMIKGTQPSRSIQLNKGADISQGQWLLFLHADSFPPRHFDEHIFEMSQKGYSAGCFQMKFDWNHPVLKFYQFFTQFRSNIFRGGDQALFIERSKFHELKGFDEQMLLMEDYEIIKRIVKASKFGILDQKIVTSARKYRKNGVVSLQWHYLIIQLMYRLGFEQNRLKKYHLKCIK